ncbi:MAG: HAD family hydrolase [Ruminococcaceae bacterium]|nr:HAD family hydrolase [Oscillospiraceae bacterium]
MSNAVIFDLDGTLWDCVENLIPSWKEVFEMYDLGTPPTADDLYGLMGKTAQQFAEAMFPQLTAEQGLEIIEKQRQIELPYLAQMGGKLYDNAEDVLDQLHQKYTLAIVSNCDSGYIETFLEHYGFGKYFSDWEFSGRTGMPKGSNIRLLMQRCGIDKAVYVGDTKLDMEAAHDAGIPFIFAEYGFGNADSEYHVQSISQLPQLAEELFAKI